MCTIREINYKRYHSDPEYRVAKIAYAKSYAQKPENVARRKILEQSPDRKKSKKEQWQKYISNPENRQKVRKQANEKRARERAALEALKQLNIEI